MENILPKLEEKLEAIAEAFSTHLDFAQARADSELWDVTVSDGLEDDGLGLEDMGYNNKP